MYFMYSFLGCPADVSGETMAEKRKQLMENYDFIRETLLHEPRGYPNDGRDAFYDRTCLWSADIFTSVWQDFFLFP